MEVLDVVVDAGEDLVLHPGRGALHERPVLEDVVGELDRVEELVRRGHLEGAKTVGAGRELPPPEVVVEDAVGRVLAMGVPVDSRIVGRAVPVEPDVADVRDEDVDAPVRVAAVVRAGPEVAERLLVAHRPDLFPPDRVHRRDGLVDVVGPAVSVPVDERGPLGAGRHPVDAEPGRADALAVGSRDVSVARGALTGAVRRPREQAHRQAPVAPRERVDSGPEIAERHRRVAWVGVCGCARIASVDEPWRENRQGTLERVLRAGDLAGGQGACKCVVGGGCCERPLVCGGGAACECEHCDRQRGKQQRA